MLLSLSKRRWVAAYLAVALAGTTAWLLLDQRLAEQTGLRRQVWLTGDFQGVPFINDVSPGATLDFLDDAPRLPRRFFSARWQGYWYVPSSQFVILHVEADDYADIWIDGELRFARIINDALGVRLDAGVHELRIDYQQYGGAANLSLITRRREARPLRADYLFPDPPAPATLRLFPDPPAPATLRLVAAISWLRSIVLLTWAAGALALALVTLRRRRTLTFLALLVVFLVVLLRTAWLSDDALITFRTVMNLTHGHGLTFNIGERVQSYTHPLWLLLLTGAYLVVDNVYYAAFFVSIGVSLAVFWLALRQAATQMQVWIVVAVLLFSRAFVDYSTSGLENPLSNLLLVAFIALAMRSHEASGSRVTGVWTVASLLYLTRPDNVLLVAPVLVWLTVRATPWTVAARQALTGLLPAAGWTAFSLIYYGFPFPNTAYAKLGTGIARGDLVQQGVVYLLDSIDRDPVTLVTILFAVALGLLSRGPARWIAGGMLAHLAYVVSIGGDFMSGRFLVLPLLAAVLLLSRTIPFTTVPALMTASVLAVIRAVSTSLRQPDSAFTVATPRHRRGATTTDRAAVAAGQRPHDLLRVPLPQHRVRQARYRDCAGRPRATGRGLSARFNRSRSGHAGDDSLRRGARTAEPRTGSLDRRWHACASRLRRVYRRRLHVGTLPGPAAPRRRAAAQSHHPVHDGPRTDDCECAGGDRADGGRGAPAQ